MDMHFPALARLAALLLLCCSAEAQQMLMGAASRTGAAKSAAMAIATEGAAVLDLGAPSRASLDRMETGTRTDGPRQIGMLRAVDVTSMIEAAASLRWTSLADGTLAARVSVRSTDAAALRVAIALDAAPAGARVRFSDAAGKVAQSVEASVVAAAVARWGAYWGPVTSGAEQVIQLELPAGSITREGMLAVKSVSHIVADPGRAIAPARAKAAGTCERDVSCSTQSDEALAKATRSVAKIVYTADGATFACTGTLVNSAGSAQVPFVMTAKHCIDSEAVAATVNTFWFLEASSCGATSVDVDAVQLAGGATLAYAGATSDIALIRLEEPAPAGAWFSGIDASTMMPAEDAVAVHHPRGDVMKLSSGRVVEPSAGVTMMSVAWLQGSTEPGSSGSGLFTARGDQYLLRGTLRGGSASCENSGMLADTSNRDYYTRLEVDSQAIRALMKAATEPTENYTDIWASISEPGTGLSITHRAGTNAMFVVSFAYTPTGRTSWISIEGGTWQSPTVFASPAYRATRGATGVSVALIGTVTLTFADGQVTMLSQLDGQPGRTGIFRRHTF